MLINLPVPLTVLLPIILLSLILLKFVILNEWLTLQMIFHFPLQVAWFLAGTIAGPAVFLLPTKKVFDPDDHTWTTEAGFRYGVTWGYFVLFIAAVLSFLVLAKVFIKWVF